MGAAFAAAFVQYCGTALIGSFIGYFAAVRGVSRGDRPKSSTWRGILLIGCIGGAVLALAFEIAFLLAFPEANTGQFETIMGMVCGMGIAMNATQRALKRAAR